MKDNVGSSNASMSEFGSSTLVRDRSKYRDCSVQGTIVTLDCQSRITTACPFSNQGLIRGGIR